MAQSLLNPAQHAAATHIDSPLSVLAGAGSGKTRVIIEKIAWLIGQGHFRAGQVRLMTLHVAKGLEFARVWLAGVEEGLLPHRHSLLEGRLEEERRLMYVGLTRAGRRVALSACRTRRQFGERTETTPSRFLDELAVEVLDWHGRDGAVAPDAAELRSSIAALKAMLDG